MQNETLLIIDDEREFLYHLKAMLKSDFKEVHVLHEPQKALALIKKNTVHKILLDMNFQRGYNTGKEGLYWLEKLHKASPTAQIYLMTAFGDIHVAVEAMKKGATDFLLKPIDKEALTQKLLPESAIKRANVEPESTPDIRFLYHQIDKVAPTKASVLITGENGTGKSELAKYLHKKSDRSSSPFVHVDLGAIPPTLFEAELFGYKKGAFTGAQQDKEGFFQKVKHGTIFLDEVSNLPFHLQSKLLTVIQESSYYRIGDPTPQQFNGRFLFATNANIRELVNNGEFRQDLLYRMNTIEMHIPPLRERPKDMKLLSIQCTDQISKAYEKEQLKLSDEAITKLCSYGWPGNIRELRHIIERAVILTDNNAILAEDIELPITQANTESSIDSYEISAITNALRQSNGNMTEAALNLGIGRTTLYRKIKKYGIKP